MHPPRTRYQKSVVDAPTSPLSSGLRVFKEASDNTKLGNGERLITRGPFRGMPMFSLTLEERATCWDGCANWTRCYGNGMPFAKRYRPGPNLEAAIAADLAVLSRRHPQGYVNRLHVLGDFYSVSYVERWANWLQQHPPLRLFGYTHWRHAHPIGRAVSDLVATYPDRAAFRRSDASEPDDPLPPAHTVARDAALPVLGTVFCPEQTGATASCTTCGLCMNQFTGVTFIDHSRQPTKRVA